MERSQTLFVTQSQSMFFFLHNSSLLSNANDPIRYISTYLDRPEVRTQLGVDPSITGNFSSCADRVGADFSDNMDAYHPTHAVRAHPFAPLRPP